MKKIIKEAIKKKGGSKTFSAIFAVLDYALQTNMRMSDCSAAESGSLGKREEMAKEERVPSYIKSEQNYRFFASIDTVLAICLNFLNGIIKEDLSVSGLPPIEQLPGNVKKINSPSVLLQFLDRTMKKLTLRLRTDFAFSVKTSNFILEHFYLHYVLSQRQKQAYLHLSTYYCILSSIFELPFDIKQPFNAYHSIILNIIHASKEKLLKDTYMLEQLFINFHCFSWDAKKQILQDFAAFTGEAKFLKELEEAQKLLTEKALLGVHMFDYCANAGDAQNMAILQSALITIYKNITIYAINNPKAVPECGKLIAMIPRVDAEFLLKLLHEVFDCLYIQMKCTNYITEQINLRSFYLIYLLEDSIIKEISTFIHPLFLETLAKAILVLDYLHLLYVTVPYISLCDDRSLQTTDRFFAGQDFIYVFPLAREGGAVRIFLKLLFSLCKISQSGNEPWDLLHYYLFHSASGKKIVKKIARFNKEPLEERKKIARESIFLGSKIPKSGSIIIKKNKGKTAVTPYSLMDISMHSLNPQTVKSHKAIIEIALDKIFANDSTLTAPNKKSSACCKLSVHRKYSAYENEQYTILSVITQLISLLHYEILDIDSYKSASPEKRNAVEFVERTKAKLSTEKYRRTAFLLHEVLVLQKDLQSTIQDWNKRILSRESKDRMKTWIKYIGGCDEINWGNTYYYLDIIITKSTAENKAHGISSLLDPTSPLYSPGEVKKGDSSFFSASCSTAPRSDAQISLLSSMDGSHSSGMQSPEKSPKQSIVESPSTKSTILSQPDYSTFDTTITSECKSLAETVDSLLKIWGPSLKAGSEVQRTEVVDVLLKAECIANPRPILTFLLQHFFKGLDRLIWNSVSHGHNRREGGGWEDPVNKVPLNESIRELGDLLKDKIEKLAVHKEKIERDELRQEFEGLAGRMYRKVLKELQSPVGVWRNKEGETKAKSLYAFIASKYQKLLSRDPLAQFLQQENKQIINFDGQVIKLDSARDSLNRAMRMIPASEEFEKNPCIHLLYKYLRMFFLKKLMAARLLKKNLAEKSACEKWIFNDFKECKLMRDVFKFRAFNGSKKPGQLGHQKKNTPLESLKASLDSSKTIPTVQTIDSGDATMSEAGGKAETEDSVNLMIRTSAKKSIFADFVAPDKKSKQFEAEMITITGAIFGIVTINTACLTFKSSERQYGPKYIYGSTPYCQIEKDMNKKYKISTIREVLVRRYNLIRQAVEIYFSNSKSIFLSFFHKIAKRKFLTTLGQIFKKKNHMKSKKMDKGFVDIIIESPESAFDAMRFKEKWMRNEITNFEYLMILNKYGGRSFNDLSQYPVFPWVLRNYGDSLSLSDKGSYRKLNLSIGAITSEKQVVADEKLSIMVYDTEMQPFQFGSHYLPARIVLGYMLRLEPFASTLIQFEQGQDSSARMFHSLKHSWDTCCKDTADNKELIPEFFYLPAMFANYNHYSYGTKLAGIELGLGGIHPKANIRVDQALLPNWAENHHHFVMMNALALESSIASEKLDKWIDMIFGFRQQDAKYYNRYKELCDEESVNRKLKSLSSHHFAEIQEFGSNPLKLFREKHPAKDTAIISKKAEYAIFRKAEEAGLNTGTKVKTVLVPAGITAKKGVIWIQALSGIDKRILAIDANASPYKISDDMLPSKETALQLEKKRNVSTPIKSLIGLDDSLKSKCIQPDLKRMFCIIEGKYFLSCHYSDNIIRVINADTWEVIAHLNFHAVTISPTHNQQTTCISLLGISSIRPTLTNTSICVTDDQQYLYSASSDGVLAKWQLRKEIKEIHPIYHQCDATSQRHTCFSIVSLDANRELDLVAAGFWDGTIILRTITNNKFFRKIKSIKSVCVNYKSMREKLRLHMIRLSFRGYIIAIIRRIGAGVERYSKLSAEKRNDKKLSYLPKHSPASSGGDFISVYSINGEVMATKEVFEYINCILLDDLGYQFATGSSEDTITKYDLLSLASTNMLAGIDQKSGGKILEDMARGGRSIGVLSLAMVKRESYEEILIGLANGYIMALKKVSS